ncbi:MAG TPA: hypothetical protein VIT23_07870 [Terrimicrobiaceae bacterium]
MFTSLPGTLTHESVFHAGLVKVGNEPVTLGGFSKTSSFSKSLLRYQRRAFVHCNEKRQLSPQKWQAGGKPKFYRSGLSIVIH